MKKIIYSQIASDESQYIVDILKKDYNWDPVFFHGTERMREWAQQNYPKSALVDSLAMRRGFFDYSDIGSVVPLDEDIIRKLSEYESTFTNWLQDSTGWNFSSSERRRYYCDVLRYWNTVINNLKPDIFVAYQWPHLPSDYGLYLLCKYYYSIPVMF